MFSQESVGDPLTENVLHLHVSALSDLQMKVNLHLQKIKEKLLPTLIDDSNETLKKRKIFFDGFFKLFDPKQATNNIGEEVKNYTDDNELYESDEFTKYVTDLYFEFAVLNIKINELIRSLNSANLQFSEASTTLCEDETNHFTSLKNNIQNNCTTLPKKELLELEYEFDEAFKTLKEQTSIVLEKLKNLVNIDAIRDLVDSLTITTIDSKKAKINSIILNEKKHRKTTVVSIGENAYLKSANSMLSKTATTVFSWGADAAAALSYELPVDKLLSDFGEKIIKALTQINKELINYQQTTGKLMEDLSIKNQTQIMRKKIAEDRPSTHSHEYKQTKDIIVEAKKILAAKEKRERMRLEEEQAARKAHAAEKSDGEKEASNGTTHTFSEFTPEERESVLYVATPYVSPPSYCAGRVSGTLIAIPAGAGIGFIEAFALYVLFSDYIDIPKEAFFAIVMFVCTVLCGISGRYTGDYFDQRREARDSHKGVPLPQDDPDDNDDDIEARNGKKEAYPKIGYASSSHAFYYSRPSSDTINLQKLEEARREAEGTGAQNKRTRCALM